MCPGRGASSLPPYRSAAPAGSARISAVDENTVQSLEGLGGRVSTKHEGCEARPDLLRPRTILHLKNNSCGNWALIELDWSWDINWLYKWLWELPTNLDGIRSLNHEVREIQQSYSDMMENVYLVLGPSKSRRYKKLPKQAVQIPLHLHLGC